MNSTRVISGYDFDKFTKDFWVIHATLLEHSWNSSKNNNNVKNQTSNFKENSYGCFRRFGSLWDRLSKLSFPENIFIHLEKIDVHFHWFKKSSHPTPQELNLNYKFDAFYSFVRFSSVPSVVRLRSLVKAQEAKGWNRRRYHPPIIMITAGGAAYRWRWGNSAFLVEKPKHSNVGRTPQPEKKENNEHTKSFSKFQPNGGLSVALRSNVIPTQKSQPRRIIEIAKTHTPTSPV